MTKYSRLERELLPIARRWHGVIPTWDARARGIDPARIRKWAAHNPDVAHPQRGIYIWFNDDPRTDYRYTHFAQILASYGPDAYLWGPTVVELLHYGDWASPSTHVSTYIRPRKKPGIIWRKDHGEKRAVFHHLPIQPPRQAIIDALPYMDWDKQLNVLDDAVQRGTFTQEEADEMVRD